MTFMEYFTFSKRMGPHGDVENKVRFKKDGDGGCSDKMSMIKLLEPKTNFPLIWPKIRVFLLQWPSFRHLVKM